MGMGFKREEMSKRGKSRESGIELLRIVAVVLIVSHHLLCHSTFDLFNEPFCVKKTIFPDAVSCSGKNRYRSFLFISVWFLADKGVTLQGAIRKIWLLWRELFFWNIVGMCCQLALPSSEPRTVNDWWFSWLNMFFPLTRNEWWYVSSYAIFLVLLPFVLPCLRYLGKENHKKCCVVLFVLWGALALIPCSNLDNGLSVVGFEYVFVLISYYKWYMKEIKANYAAILVVLGTLVILIWNIALPMLIPDNSSLLMDFLWPVEKEWSIPILMISFGLFELLRRATFHSSVINMIATSSFGVYLATEQPFIREQLWSKWIVLSDFYDSKYAIAQAILCIIIVCVVASALDLLRGLLFDMTINRHRGAWFDKLWSMVASENKRQK